MPRRKLNPDFEPHPLANIFPLMNEEEYARLKDSIKKNGLDELIIIHEGKILDGRNRYRACEELGVECFHAEYISEDVSALDYVLLKNRDRRHLTPSQLADVGAKLRAVFDEEARERQKTSTGGRTPQLQENSPEAESKGQSRDLAGAAVGVSGFSIDAATKVHKKGTPALQEALTTGKIAVSKAAKIAELPAKEQDAIVSGKKQFTPAKKPKPVAAAKKPSMAKPRASNSSTATGLGEFKERHREFVLEFMAGRVKSDGLVVSGFLIELADELEVTSLAED